MSNVAADPRRAYELDPTETVERIETIEAAGDVVLGFYHSHPVSPAEPSHADHERASWPGYLYCIVSVRDGELAGFEWTGESFEPLTVRVVDAE